MAERIIKPISSATTEESFQHAQTRILHISGVTPLIGRPGQCGWTNGITYYGNNFNTHFNALQVTLAKQFTHGLSMNANYAWQHAISWATGLLHLGSTGAVKGNDSFLRRQQIIIYGLYELPFGRNKMFGSNVNGVVNQIIGGWQLSPILNYSSGLPFTLSLADATRAFQDRLLVCNGDPDSSSSTSLASLETPQLLRCADLGHRHLPRPAWTRLELSEKQCLWAALLQYGPCGAEELPDP